MRAGCASLSGVALDSPTVDEGVDGLSDFGFDGTDTVANPRAGLEAGFFFFLFGGITAEGVAGVGGRIGFRWGNSADGS